MARKSTSKNAAAQWPLIRERDMDVLDFCKQGRRAFRSIVRTQGQIRLTPLLVGTALLKKEGDSGTHFGYENCSHATTFLADLAAVGDVPDKLFDEVAKAAEAGDSERRDEAVVRLTKACVKALYKARKDHAKRLKNYESLW